MTKIGEFHIEDVFEITGKGIVFAGRIVDGIVSIGNQIEIITESKFKGLDIKNVEGIKHSNPELVNIGLVIECKDDEEKERLKNSKSILKTVSIYNNRLKLSELKDWFSTKTISHKIMFIELFLSDLTTMNRSIWSDESTSDNSKIESLKWSNELSHKLWNITFELKRSKDNDSGKRLSEHISFYAKQSKELAGHLGSSTKLTIDRFYKVCEKNAPQQNL